MRSESYNAVERVPSRASGKRADATAGMTAHSCLWCSKAFVPRKDGGKPQVFCRPACRRGFDAAGRRWVAEAIATGTLSLGALRNGPGATRALVPTAISPVPISASPNPTPVAPAERPDEAAELLDDFLIALLELPGELWSDIALALPDELYDRIDRYLNARLSEGA